MRASKIEANEYKDYILGFIFYRFLSEKQEEAYYKDGGTVEDIENDLVEENKQTVESYQRRIGYFIPYKNLFSTWLNDNDFNVSNVSVAINSFDRLVSKTNKKVYEKIFDTLREGLSKLGDSSGEQTKAIKDIIVLIKDIPMDEKQDYDVLGFIYEYLISMFAANAGKKAGEFYTPHEVSLLMSEIVADHLKDRNKIDIYDPTSGSGSLLINIGKTISKHMVDKNRIIYYAQELKENTYSLTRMNLIMRGILPDNIKARNGNTLADDWPYFDEEKSYEPLFVDAVVSNPPYSQKWDPTNRENDARFKSYGLAPKSKADYAFLLHDLYHLRSNGIMTIVLPHGVLFRGGEEAKIRENLIEKNNIDTIIGLPANIFFGTSIPTIIMVLKKQKESSDVLIIDASKGFEKVGKNNRLRSSDIKKIVDTYISRESIPNYSRLVSKEEIKNNEYNLNIPRYVDSSEKAESWDMYSNIYGGLPKKEIDSLEEYWKAFPSLKKELFDSINTHSATLKVEDINETINDNEDVKRYKEKFNDNFKDFYDYLKNKLIDSINDVDPSKEVIVITDNIFKRLENIPLVDKYDAYQLFDNEWTKIATDLEIIREDGIEAITKVDPNYVVKKKENKEIEVQEGYVGRILPFVLIQKECFKQELEELEALNSKKEEYSLEMSNLFEEIDEEDREDDCIDSDKNEFNLKEIGSRVKALKKQQSEDYTSLDKIVIKVNELSQNIKELNKEIKNKKEALEKNTKEKIEGLDLKDALSLLEIKWISPIVESIQSLPELVIKNLVVLIKKINKKYEDTLIDLNAQIDETEKELSEMLDDLDADEYDSKALLELKSILGGKN